MQVDSWRASVERTSEPTKSRQHFSIREIRISSARIREHKHPRIPDPLRLRTETGVLGLRKQRSKQRDTDQDDDLRLKPPDFCHQRTASRLKFGRLQLVDAGRCPRDQVGDPESPLGEPPVVGIPDAFGDKPGIIDKLPEPIRIPGEMMAGRRRAQAGINPDEQHAYTRPNRVAQISAAPPHVFTLCPLPCKVDLMNWLFKEEPSSYSYSDLVKDGRTQWAGVKNPLAQKHLRSVKKGDRIFYYHTGDEKAIVGIAKALTDSYPDPGDPGGKRVVVDIAPQRAMERPVTLAEIKARKSFASFPLTRIPRLSVMPVTEKEWEEIMKMAELGN